MTNITLPRAELQRVLEALESEHPEIQLRAAIALRKRLAQPDRPMIPDDFPREGLVDD